MRKLLILSSLAIFLGQHAVSTVRADYDPVLEAQEAAERQARAAADAKRQAEASAQMAAAKDKAYRQALGAEAKGLSGADLERAYNAKMARDQKAMMEKQAEAMKMFQQGQQQYAGSKEKTDAAMKQAFGKSVGELQNMSDEELEAFSKQLEKQFGVAAGQ